MTRGIVLCLLLASGVAARTVADSTSNDAGTSTTESPAPAKRPAEPSVMRITTQEATGGPSDLDKDIIRRVIS